MEAERADLGVELSLPLENRDSRRAIILVFLLHAAVFVSSD